MDTEIGIQSFGISVKGPLHKKRREPNQDAWRGGKAFYGSYIVVCDGLGSRKQSHLGAAAACVAVKMALRHWCASHDSKIENLIQLIKAIWEVQVAPIDPSDAATTCLFSVFIPNLKRLIVAGLGDGIGLVKSPEHSLRRIISRTDGFGDRTIALGTPHTLKDWQFASIENVSGEVSVLLATDGIADDLIPAHQPDFLEWLIQTFGPYPSLKRFYALRRELDNWPVPKHQDDKTLAVLYTIPTTDR